MKWHIQSLGEIYDRGEGSAVYYDPRSGDTHLISEFAVHLIRNLANRPCSTEQLIDLMSADIEPQDAAELQAAVPAIVNLLHELDIIQSH